MRLWSLHPRHLDAQGLVALWREGLLAQAVLQGKTRGYQHHPQLRRFRSTPDPVASLATYLHAVATEAKLRGYRFAADKIAAKHAATRIGVTDGQRDYEWQHLGGKLQRRSPQTHAHWTACTCPELHPLFYLLPGPVADWEVRPKAAAHPASHAVDPRPG